MKLVSKNKKKGSGIFKNIYLNINNRFSKNDDNILKNISEYYSKENIYISLKKRKNIRENIINRIIYIINNINQLNKEFKEKTKTTEYINNNLYIYNVRLYNIINKINNKVYSYFYNDSFHIHINFNENFNNKTDYVSIMHNNEEMNKILFDFVISKLISLKIKFYDTEVKDIFSKIENKKNVNHIISIIVNKINKPSDMYSYKFIDNPSQSKSSFSPPPPPLPDTIERRLHALEYNSKSLSPHKSSPHPDTLDRRLDALKHNAPSRPKSSLSPHKSSPHPDTLDRRLHALKHNAPSRPKSSLSPHKSSPHPDTLERRLDALKHNAPSRPKSSLSPHKSSPHPDTLERRLHALKHNAPSRPKSSLSPHKSSPHPDTLERRLDALKHNAPSRPKSSSPPPKSSLSPHKSSPHPDTLERRLDALKHKSLKKFQLLSWQPKISVNPINNKLEIQKIQLNMIMQNQRYVKLLNHLNKKKHLHSPFLSNDITDDGNYYYITIIKPYSNLKYFMDNIKDPILHFNALQQLLFVCMSFHKLTGMLHGNLNIANIYYYKIDTDLNSKSYFGYYFQDNTFYIQNMGYLWIILNFTETMYLPNKYEIFFNEDYKKLNKDYEPYHMYFEYRAILEIYKEFLINKVKVDTRFVKLEKYVNILLDKTKNINNKYKTELINKNLNKFTKLLNIDIRIFRDLIESELLLLSKKDINNKSQIHIFNFKK